MHNLGLPGLHLLQEPQRVYPAGDTAVHVLGHTNVDNQGLAGIEKYIDSTPAGRRRRHRPGGSRPACSSRIDLRIQHALHEELTAAQKRYQAQAIGGIVLDVHTGEVMALAGLPDYDPNRREESLKQGLHNRFYYDAYELGSVFKTFAIAMALDSGVARIDDRIDVLTPLRMGRFTLYDRHAHTRTYTVEEVFTHSSNTGAARLALAAGARTAAGIFRKARPDGADADRARRDRAAAFPGEMARRQHHDHGIWPRHLRAALRLRGGGGGAHQWRTQDHAHFPAAPARVMTAALGEQVVSAETSAAMRHMFLANVEHGTGTQAKVPGYRVGGKTGTAWKPVKGGYSQDVITSFVAAFPMDDPQYLVLIVIDEPKPEQPGKRNEAGHNAAPTAGAIIRRIAPMLGIAPARTFDESRQASY